MRAPTWISGLALVEVDRFRGGFAWDGLQKHRIAQPMSEPFRHVSVAPATPLGSTSAELSLRRGAADVSFSASAPVSRPARESSVSVSCEAPQLGEQTLLRRVRAEAFAMT